MSRTARSLSTSSEPDLTDRAEAQPAAADPHRPRYGGVSVRVWAAPAWTFPAEKGSGTV
jgi:hypothetical protein